MVSALAVLVGLLELVGGLAIALGFQARWAALALGLFTLVASVLFPQVLGRARDQAFVQQLMFMKNLSVAGGLLHRRGAERRAGLRRCAPGSGPRHCLTRR